MKLRIVPSSNLTGNALLVTMIFIIVLTLTIGGYMSYVMQQARFGSRSQAWNMALAVSEAGIEEGLQHLNADAIADSNDLQADGWQALGNLQYTVSRNLNSGSFPANYSVTINFANSNEPIITAIAYVTPPAAARKSSPFFYATTTVNNNVSTGNTAIGRGVVISCIKPPFFNAALVAKGSVDMNGNNLTVDSFDSGVAGDNVGGQWNSSVSGDEGIVASMGGITNSSVSIGNANVYGDLYSGVNEATNVGANGFVGTHAWVAAGGTGFEPGREFNDANFTFPDTSFPYGAGGGLTPTSNTVLVATGTNTSAFTNFNSASLPSGLTNGQTVGPITTNVADITVSTYPGAMGGLVTNISSTTTQTYPGSEPGLSTNCVGFTTVTTDPGPEPCASTNTITTNVTSTAEIPSPLPSGLATNYVATPVYNNGGKLKGYTTNIDYSYSITYYTYANQLSYTYDTITYTYATNTYTYTVFSQMPTYSTNSYDDVLSGGNYYSATGLGNTIVTGNSTLVLPNGYSIANLTIAPGGSLTIYAGGTSMSLSGNNTINADGLAQNLIIYAAPSVTTVSFSGTSSFEGVIVAPDATVTLTGGGNNVGISGAIMANSIVMNGHYNFHYDVALSRVPSPGRYIANSWQEISIPQQ